MPTLMKANQPLYVQGSHVITLCDASVQVFSGAKCRGRVREEEVRYPYRSVRFAAADGNDRPSRERCKLVLGAQSSVRAQVCMCYQTSLS